MTCLSFVTLQKEEKKEKRRENRKEEKKEGR